LPLAHMGPAPKEKVYIVLKVLQPKQSLAIKVKGKPINPLAECIWSTHLPC